MQAAAGWACGPGEFWRGIGGPPRGLNVPAPVTGSLTSHQCPLLLAQSHENEKCHAFSKSLICYKRNSLPQSLSRGTDWICLSQDEFLGQVEHTLEKRGFSGRRGSSQDLLGSKISDSHPSCISHLLQPHWPLSVPLQRHALSCAIAVPCAWYAFPQVLHIADIFLTLRPHLFCQLLKEAFLPVTPHLTCFLHMALFLVVILSTIHHLLLPILPTRM